MSVVWLHFLTLHIYMVKLKHLIFENQQQTLYKLATEYRNKYMDDDCSVEGMCSTEAEGLFEFLRERGIKNVRKYHGLYFGADDRYEPVYVDYIDADDYSDPDDGYNHWWVVVDNKYIVDVTADQFHPYDPDDYKIIVTSINDLDYSNFKSHR